MKKVIKAAIEANKAKPQAKRSVAYSDKALLNFLSKNIKKVPAANEPGCFHYLELYLPCSGRSLREAIGKTMRKERKR
jgi:hypothetical protein